MKGDGWYSFPPPKPGDEAARAVHFLSVLYTSYMQTAARDFDVILRPISECGRATTYAFQSLGRGRGINAPFNALRFALQRLGVYGLGRSEKFIPQQYKTVRHEDRYQILAGLLDTDGSLAKGGYDYMSKSRLLAEDVSFVARSPGPAAYVKEISESSVYKGEAKVGTNWRVSISGDCSPVPCRVARKAARPRLQKKDVLRAGFTVHPVGVANCAGFEIDGDGRFLLGEFTVTHNSVIGSHLADRWNGIVAGLTHSRFLDSQWRGYGSDIQASTIHEVLSDKPPWTEYGEGDLLVVDEAHHYFVGLTPSDGNTWGRAMMAFPGLRVGLTAPPAHTPFREEPDECWDALLLGPEKDALIGAGHLVPLERVQADFRSDAPRPRPAITPAALKASAAPHLPKPPTPRWMTSRTSATTALSSSTP